MRSVSRSLAATVTALLYMTLSVESLPPCNNAPVALLLPNGTIVMVPGKNENHATKTSNELYHSAHKNTNPCTVETNNEPVQRRKLVKSVERRINQQLTHSFSTGASKSALLDSVEKWIEKPYSQPSLNTITYSSCIPSDSCKQIGKVEISNTKKVFPDKYKPAGYCFNNSKDFTLNAGSIKRGHSAKFTQDRDARFCTTGIADGSSYNLRNGEAAYNHLDHYSTTKNDLSYARHQTQGNRGFQNNNYEVKGENKRPSKATLARTINQISKRRIFSTGGIPDGVERDFDHRNTKHSISNTNNLNHDPTKKLNQEDERFHTFNIHTERPSNTLICEALSNCLNNKQSTTENQLRHTWARPTIQRYDFSNYKDEACEERVTRLIEPVPSKTPRNDWNDCSNEEESSEDVLTKPSIQQGTDGSNSKYPCQREGNLAGFRLNLFGERNLGDNAPFTNEKHILGIIQKHSLNDPTEIEESDVPYANTSSSHNTPETKELSQNCPSCGFFKSLVNKESCFEDPVDFSCNEYETEAQNQCPFGKPTENGINNMLKEKRAYLPNFRHPNCYRYVVDKRPNFKNCDSESCGLINTKDVPKHFRKQSTESGIADIFRKTPASSSWQQVEEQQRLSPDAQNNYCHRGPSMEAKNGESREDSDYSTHLKTEEEDNAVNKWEGRWPAFVPGNEYTRGLTEKPLMGMKGPRSANSMCCRDNYVNGFHRNDAGNGCANCNSFQKPQENNWLENGNAIWCNHHSGYKQETSYINFQPDIFQNHQEIEPMVQATNFQVVPPRHLNFSCIIESADPNAYLKGPPTFLDQHPDCQVLQGSHTLCFPTGVSALPSLTIAQTQSTDSLDHCMILPWIIMPIHYSPQPMTFASFVKYEDDIWRLIHCTTIFL